ncbi:two-component system histidine kinase PnpS [Aerococcus christensenii]|uniref:two-component system histidine kinase PnpS n=1 Tax=Aerococcus christensenii TaxID=87541 RepID=UPI0023A95B25|nr:HAMP domain-containing sensor histidine kinase [Aerococcus christensenii]WEB70831.1 ATP-binding protein [Aerococcus christensenii]
MKRLTLGLTAIFSILFLTLSLIFSLNANTLVQTSMEDQTKTFMEETAHTLEKACQNLTSEDLSNETENWRVVRQELLSVSHSVEKVSVYNKEGKEICHLGNDRLKSENPGVVSSSPDSSNDFQFKRLDRPGHEAFYEYSGNLTNQQGDFLAYIRIVRPATDIADSRLRLFRFSILGSLMMTVLLYVALRIYFRQISQPIDSLSQLVGKLNKHDYSLRYDQLGVEELDALGDRVNRLADNLSQQGSQISMQEERLKLLMNYLVVGILMMDKDHQIKVVNRAAYRILNLNDKVLNHTYEEILKDQELKEMIAKGYKKKKNTKSEITFHSTKKRIVDVNVLYVPQNREELSFGEQVIVLLYDITEIRHLEEVRSEFVANASHELKTPITVIKGFTETLLDGALEDPVSARYFVELMDKESDRLGQLINDTLDLARIEQDKREHRIENVCLDELIEEILIQLRQKAQKRQVQLHFENLFSKPIDLISEPSRIKQIMLNLIINAIKYNHPQGGDVWISIDSQSKSGLVIIKVKDNGIGIPKKDLPRIFERFYRVDKARSKASGGTGLGLSIVRNLVKSMDGHILVESKWQEGTCFTVYLPSDPRGEED